ncbi:MAG: hypothetical protein WAN08_24010 [Candidatus Sulfotelmatobacter sp.]
MKPTKQLFLTALMLAAFSAGAWAQTASPVTLASNEAHNAAAAPAAAAPAPSVVTAADVQALKDALATQQRQIERLTQQLQQMQAVNQPKNDAGLKNVSQASLDTPTLQPAVLTLQEPQPAEAATQEPKINKEMEGALTIHFKGVNITPGGFAAAEFLRRSRALGADVVTPFNNLTMPGASQSSLPEFFGTARQSRPTIFISSRAGNVDFSGYISGDFLSSGVTSTATQTNGYTFRLRQVWGQAKFAHGWSILGGQAWSLVTESKVGTGPSDDTGRTNDARPATIDGAYNVGFTFARQDGIRVTKSFGDKVAVAFAVENAQATVTSSGNTNDYVLVQAGASNTNNTTSTYGFNPSPDLIAKIAFDPGFGHYEIFGLSDRFQDRIFPCENFTSTGTPPVVTAVLPACPALTDGGTTAGAYNATRSGGGFGINARWAFYNKHIVFGVHGFGGSGVGRYGASQLSDVSINADGTVHPVKDLQGLATLEWHGKKLDVYSYVGSEYAARTYSYDPVQNVFVGYGAPTFNNSGCYTETAPTTGTLTGSTPISGSLSKCSAQTRNITEGTLGFWYRFHNGPRGRYQWGMQYSYLTRQTWSGVAPAFAPSGSPEGLDSMVFTSFRYYLP